MVDYRTSSSGGELTLDPPAPARRSRRTALWGVLAVVAVAAGALAVTSGGGSDDELPKLPVALGADGGGAGREATMSADMSMAAWVTYVAGEDLPALGGEAPAYRVTGSIDETNVRALADALGMDGEPTEQDGYWHLEAGDATLDVYPGTGGAWSYWVEQGTRLDVGSGSTGSSTGSAGCADGATTCTTIVTEPADTPVADCAPGTKCVEPTPVTTSPCPPDAMCTLPVEECPPNADCAIPEPVQTTVPIDLPSEDEARRIALDLLTSTGMDVADAKVTVDGPYDAWYVNVEPTVDGTPVSGWYASVSVGSQGTVLNANGILTGAERLGDYPVLDTTAAIDRLNAQQGDWQAYPLDEDLSARSGPVSTSVSASASAGASSEDSAASAPAAGTSQSETIATSVEPVEPSCKEQPDGREICEPVTTVPGECVPIVPGQTPDGEVPAIAQCAEPMPMPEPVPEPEPIEVVLTEAERILVLLPAIDDSGDSYLVPGYRLGAEDGTSVDVAAVADESLAPTTTVEEETPQTRPATPGQECEVLTEDDGSGTTHTVQTCPGGIQPSDPEVRHLSDGETPELGVAYYVDVETHCGSIVWAGRWWRTAAPTPLGWSSPTEGGSFTLTTPDEGIFVGDAAGTKTATFTSQGAAADIPGCG